jgi:HK97 gp10 family phage protein
MAAGGEISFDISEFKIEIDRAAVERLAGGPDMKKALQLVGQAGEASAKTHAPVDTGNLRRSITHELGSSGINQYVRIGTNVDYAVFQELGTRYHDAHPFLRPAMEDVRKVIRG